VWAKYRRFNVTADGRYSCARVEAGWNTSTVALRVVGGDEKGTQCLGHPVPGGYKIGDLALQVWGSLESEAVKYGHESRGTMTPRITALARASSNCNRQTHPLVRESAPHQ
jgi:hypothetical protein